MTLEEAALEVMQAIDDPGPVPGYHRHIMGKHMHEWPTLWRALGDLRRALDNQE